MPPITAKAALFQCVVSVVHYPREDLEDTTIPMWVWHGVLLKDLDAVPTVSPIEMVPQSTFMCGTTLGTL